MCPTVLLETDGFMQHAILTANFTNRDQVDFLSFERCDTAKVAYNLDGEVVCFHVYMKSRIDVIK